MDIFDQAMGIEGIGRDLYARFALEETNEEMRKIFDWLADREEDHFQIFKKMKQGQLVSFPQFTLLSDVMDIFEAWKEKASGVAMDASKVDLYRKALEAEKKSVSVYKEYAASAEGSRKKIFLQIAAEEETHQRILENIIAQITESEK